MELKYYHDYGKELERRIRPLTFPLAIKVLKKGEKIPDGVKRPVKDLGEQMALCTGFAMSRREGTALAMLKEDMLCFEPVVGYGIEKAPELFLQGHNRYPLDVMNLEAGANYAEEFPKLEYGNTGIMSAPLASTPFKPDIVMLYCNSEQLSLLLLGREYKDGRNLKCSLSSHAACVYGVVTVLQTGQYHVALPCRGDRYFYAMAGPDELIFSIPEARMDDLMEGLKHVEKCGSRLPKGYGKRPGDESNYITIGKMLGMDL